MGTECARHLQQSTFRGVQALRGVAALLVVAHHATICSFNRLGDPDGIWLNGAAGVDIFFVISGFVMALSTQTMARSLTSAKGFLVRRVERVAPLYWIFTTAKILLILRFASVAVHGLGSLWSLIASYLFLPSWNPSFGVYPVLEVGWTLIFEMMFYVLLAAALALRLAPLRTLAIGLVCIAALSPFVPVQTNAFCSLFNPISLEFLYGMLLHAAFVRRFKILGYAKWFAPVGIAVILRTVPHVSLRPITWGLSALSIVATAVALESSVGAYLPRWILSLGNSSYSLYLSHTFLVTALGIVMLRLHVHGAHAWIPAVLSSLVVCSLAGEVIYRSLELPMIRFFASTRRKRVCPA
jgi:exopolysaccharide production protein ExoZ